MRKYLKLGDIKKKKPTSGLDAKKQSLGDIPTDQQPVGDFGERCWLVRRGLCVDGLKALSRGENVLRFF